MRLLFSVTLFLSAVLLFLLQPMVGKKILPLAGGTPAVWNTCMVFFQGALLGGYWYAHRTTQRFGPRGQSAMHVPLLLLPLLALAVSSILTGSPLYAIKSLAPSGQQYPFFQLVLLLVAMVGLPFFFISTTAPLLQRWFADTSDPAAKDPYFLYAASNLGSFVGLLLYPTVLERYDLTVQMWIFGAGFAGWVALIAACAMVLRRSSAPVPVYETAPKSDQPAALVTWADRAGWICLAAVPSSLMLSVTSFATTDLAPIPLFFIVPLGIYLLTFVVAFGISWGWVYRLNGLLFPMLLLVFVFLKATNSDQSLPRAVGQYIMPRVEQIQKQDPQSLGAYLRAIGDQVRYGPRDDNGAPLEKKELPINQAVWCYIGYHLIVFTVIALGCHLELARRRPPAARLTEFFLWVSVGGVLGGLFNGLVAPVAFVDHTEYLVGILAATFVIPPSGAATEDPPARRNRAAVIPLLFGVVLYVMTTNYERWSETGPLQAINEWCRAPAGSSGRTLLIVGLAELAVGIGSWAVAFWKAKETMLGRRMSAAGSVLIATSLLALGLAWLDDHKTDQWLPLVQAGICFTVAALACLPFAARWTDVAWPVVLTLGVVFVLGHYDQAKSSRPISDWFEWLESQGKDWSLQIRMIVCFGIPALLCFLFVERPMRFGLATSGVFLVGAALLASAETKPLFAGRSFFGTLKVSDDDHYHQLDHGTTTHGIQYWPVDPATQRRAPLDEPMTYYHKDGPVGDMFRFTRLDSAPAAETPLAFIGLGTGSLAAYARPEQSITFYEIDPLVRRIAENENYFGYLKAATNRGAKVNFVMGDARLKLEAAPDSHYALIAVDAFSSDAIPIHLLTKDALELYFQKARPDGIVALHVSNRYLDLPAVVARISDELGLSATTYQWADNRKNTSGRYASTWIVLTKNGAALGDLPTQPAIDEAGLRWRPYYIDAAHRQRLTGAELDQHEKLIAEKSATHYVVKPVSLWTDEHSNMLEVFAWGPDQ